MAMIVWHPSIELVQAAPADPVSANEARAVAGADVRSSLQKLISVAVMSGASSARPAENEMGHPDRFEFSYKPAATLNSVVAHTQVCLTGNPAASSMTVEPDTGPGSRPNVGYWLWIADVNSIATPPIHHVSVPALVEDGAWMDIDSVVSAWKQLPPDWDGDDTVAPAASDFASLERFTALARVSGIRSPSPFIAGDGEIGLRWSDGAAFASVAFLEGGRVLGYCESPEGRAATRLDANEPTDEQLGEILNSLRLI